MTAPELIDPFHRRLREELVERIATRVNNLAAGSAARAVDSVTTVAEKYAAQTSYLQALNDVLELCKELDRERYGVSSTED